MKRVEAVYKPIGMALGLGGGLLASAAFRRVWKVMADEDDAPDAKDEGRDWPEILLAAAVQGAIFAVVRAAVDRSGAIATRRLTGTWPA
ncbi:DUF4235 domain-containing protein [Streptomyces roseolus]|uniref:DUF4235 domain-containing protein n=1 Tax=Streptomyces roseolus TaxID=67358 RepID=UPI00167C2E29|nr:DUF4235 domain-containing protein [Streptomyces roseolus]GGR41337.1 membrane protein [Streptomyces roseolus]